jgi:hypothetical protein
MGRVHVTAVAMEKQRFRLCMVVDIHVDANNAKMLVVGMETQRCVPSALLPNYKIFCAAVYIINVKINIAQPPCN